MTTIPTWRRIAVRLDYQHPEEMGTPEAWACTRVPGLAITRDRWHDGRRFSFWCITHVVTGAAVTKCLPSMHEAGKLVLALGRLGSWDRSASEIAADFAFRAAVVDVLNETHDRLWDAWRDWYEDVGQPYPLHYGSNLGARYAPQEAQS